MYFGSTHHPRRYYITGALIEASLFEEKEKRHFEINKWLPGRWEGQASLTSWVPRENQRCFLQVTVLQKHLEAPPRAPQRAVAQRSIMLNQVQLRKTASRPQELEARREWQVPCGTARKELWASSLGFLCVPRFSISCHSFALYVRFALWAQTRPSHDDVAGEGLAHLDSPPARYTFFGRFNVYAK